MINDNNESYRWVYELPMTKSFFLLFEVWKVLGVAACFVFVFNTIVTLCSGGNLSDIVYSIEMSIVVMLILMLLSLPAYWIVTKANNNKYTVLFEMDARGIEHTQIKTVKAKALDALEIFTGIALRSRTTTAAGFLSASGTSLYSKFSKVKRIKVYPEKNLIVLNGSIVNNQIYVEDKDFDFVKNFIIDHCPMAVLIDNVKTETPKISIPKVELPKVELSKLGNLIKTPDKKDEESLAEEVEKLTKEVEKEESAQEEVVTEEEQTKTESEENQTEIKE